MTPDDITRLAERVADMDIVCNMTHLAARDLCETRDAIAAELRTIAQQQGKAGGVAECRSISDDIMDVVDRLGSEFGDVDPRCWDHLRIYLPPAHSPKAGGHVEGKVGMVPEGWQLVPVKATPEMRDALRRGSRKDCPSDELCDVRYTALLSAASTPEAQPGHECRAHKCVRMRAEMQGEIDRLRGLQDVAALHIPRSESLDPIYCYLEDFGPGVGRITIACYGDAWTGAWGAMGNRTVRQFVAGCDPGYLSGSLLELRKASEHFRKYTERVSTAVIDALLLQVAAGQTGDR